MAAIEDREAHAHSFSVAALSAASAVSYCRLAWPTAAHTTISKIWSSLRPDSLAAAMSSSVTRWACLATLSMSMVSGSASPALSNAARRWACDALPSPSRIRASSAWRAFVISDMPIPPSKPRQRGQTSRGATPITLGVEDAAHLLASCSVEVKTAMLQLDARRVFPIGDETHLDFRLQSRIILPVSADLPVMHQTRVRFPHEHSAPVTRAAVVTALVPATADARLDHRVHRRGLADFVDCQR